MAGFLANTCFFFLKPIFLLSLKRLASEPIFFSKMQIINYPQPQDWQTLLARPIMDFEQIRQKVVPILEAVRQNGDQALFDFSLQFDKVQLNSLLVSDTELENAESQIEDSLKIAIQVAKSNIEKFHSYQKEKFMPIETMNGVNCWRKSVAIQKVGLYIPSGTAPLFSTVLMLGIPAKIAGCQEIVLCSPPNQQGNIHPAILYAAKLVGITKIIKVGGSQAIAAMAYGTESVPKVYKIFGPGNQYVTAAKQLVSLQEVAIDMPAGPSEVAIWADDTANPVFVAADLLSQAEHGTDSQVVLFTKSEILVEKVLQELQKQLAVLPRKEIAEKAIENSKCFVLKKNKHIAAMLNEYAAEHLIISTKRPDKKAEKIYNAGSIFLGHFTPESAGDYASGTNHTLPTNGFAKTYSGVSLDSFVKKITYQKITEEGLQNIGQYIEQMAAAEDLIAHKRAVSLRLAFLKEKKQRLTDINKPENETI